MTRRRRFPRGRIPGLVVATVLAVVAPDARAEELNGYVELIASENTATERQAGATTAENENRTVARRLTFSFVRRPYEWIRFWAGGSFEDEDPISIVDGVRADGDVQRIRPYVGIGRRTKDLTIDLLWGRDQTRSRTDGSDVPWNIRDRYSTTVTWSPDRGPNLRASLRRNDDRDEDRRFRDQLTDIANLDLSQEIGDTFRWSYRGVRADQRDRISGTDTTTDSHRVSVAYEDPWFDDRWSWRSEYTAAYRATEARISGGGPADVPVFPTAGLSGRDDTPLIVTLPPNPALIDDDVTADAGVDLGVPPPAGDDRPWAIGLEFLQSQTVDTLFVWADRDVRPEVAQVFRWVVYTSANNVEWTPEATIAAAPFDEFRRRWELRFAPLTARYVKVVVAPLSASDPFASEYDDLFVTELDAARRVSAPGGRVESSDTVHTLRNDTRARLLRDRDLYFEGNYYVTDVQGQDPNYRLSNGLSYAQVISPEATFTARTTLETSSDEVGSDAALVYSASLAVSPVPRLRYTVALSGRDERTNDIVGGDQTSVFFYGFATLVDGVDVQVGASRNFQEALDGRVVQSTRVNATVRVEPRDDLSFGANYEDTVSERRDTTGGLPDVTLRTAEVNATWVPFPTVYLYSSYRREWRSQLERNDIRQVVASWSPFPGGGLRFAINYNETRRALNDQTERTAGPSVRWYLNPRAYISAVYTTLLDESENRRVDTDLMSVALRWGF